MSFDPAFILVFVNIKNLLLCISGVVVRVVDTKPPYRGYGITEIRPPFLSLFSSGKYHFSVLCGHHPQHIVHIVREGMNLLPTTTDSL